MRDFTTFFSPPRDAGGSPVPLDGFLLFTYGLNLEYLQEDLLLRILSPDDPYRDEQQRILAEQRLRNLPAIIIVDPKETHLREGYKTCGQFIPPLMFIKQADVMHLKLWIATFKNTIRIFIGSANLTPSALGTTRTKPNLECGCWFEINVNKYNRVDTRDLAKMLASLVKPKIKKITGHASKESRWLDHVIKKLRRPPKKGIATVITSFQDSLYNKIKKRVKINPSRLSIMTPYFDGKHIGKLPFGRLENTELTLYSNFEKNGQHQYMDKSVLDALPKKTNFFSVLYDSDGMEMHESLWHRHTHAKIYVAPNWAAIGSPNFTHAAWRTSVTTERKGGNLEGIILFPALSGDIERQIKALFKPEMDVEKGWYRLPHPPDKKLVEYAEQDRHKSPSGWIHVDFERKVAMINWRIKTPRQATIHWNGLKTNHKPGDKKCKLPSTIIEEISSNNPLGFSVSFNGTSEILPLVLVHPPPPKDFIDKIPLDYWFSSIRFISANSGLDSSEKKEHDITGSKSLQIEEYRSIVFHIDALMSFISKWRRNFPSGQSLKEASQLLDEYIENQNLSKVHNRILHALLEERLSKTKKISRKLSPQEKKVLGIAKQVIEVSRW